MAKTTTKGKNKVKKDAKPAATEADDEEDDEVEGDLDELDEDEAEDTPPKKKAGDEVVFGVADLAKYLGDKSGKKVTTRELRTLIRKMARDGKGRVEREITPGNRTRYNWSGLGDPEVKAIIKAFNSGELEDDKQAKLKELKERKAAKVAAAKAESETAGDDEDEAPKPKKKAGKKKAAKKPAPVEVEDDDEELELDEDDDE